MIDCMSFNTSVHALFGTCRVVFEYSVESSSSQCNFYARGLKLKLKV